MKPVAPSSLGRLDLRRSLISGRDEKSHRLLHARAASQNGSLPVLAHAAPMRNAFYAARSETITLVQYTTFALPFSHAHAIFSIIANV